MKMRIAGLVEESIVDGPGFRMAVFAQGCHIHCPGCHNPETHDPDGGREADTEDMIARMRQNPLLDGITLSGGDPMCQPEPCLALARAAHDAGLNVWAYTGYTWEALLTEANPARMALLKEIDVLVDGPFLLAQRSLELKFCGSRNQRLLDVRQSLEAGAPVLWQQPSWDAL